MYYKEALIIANVKDQDGCAVLDVPFQVYRCTAVLDNKIYYALTPDLIGGQVLALVAYMVDHPIVKQDDTYAVASLGDGVVAMDWNDIPVDNGYIVPDFQTDDRVKQFWNVTKQEFFATFDEQGNKTLYDGEDKDRLAAFYPSELMS